MRDLLVTGTDTGVGKTVIASALVAALRARGVRALGFKPVETGLADGELPDSARLAAAAGEETPLARPLLQLSEPLAPAVAAERAGVAIAPADIEARIAALRREGYSLIVEGAGGVLVPLTWEGHGDRAGYTVLDLAARCGFDVVVVGRAGLGTLNHMVMTVEMLRRRGIAIAGLVLNGRTAIPDLAETTNPGVLARMLPGIPVVTVPLSEGGVPVDVISCLERLLPQ